MGGDWQAMKENKAITQKAYWDQIYVNREEHVPINFMDFRHYVDSLILELIKHHFIGEKLLEVGAGSSDWLINISKELGLDACTGLDYSEIGCDALKVKSEKADMNVEVICADMFYPPEHMIGNFDFIVSFGVVEHFENLAETMRAISTFAKLDGLLFTLIPNMAGLNGTLTKRWNKAVYDLHIPHDLDSFVKGHEEAGLDVLYSSYLGSTNFGVISSCFEEKKGVKFWLYKQFSRTSKMFWFVEKHIAPLPVTKLLSPYIVVVSRVSK